MKNKIGDASMKHYVIPYRNQTCGEAVPLRSCAWYKGMKKGIMITCGDVDFMAMIAARRNIEGAADKLMAQGLVMVNFMK